MQPDHPLLSLFDGLRGMVRIVLQTQDGKKMCDSHHIPVQTLPIFPLLNPTNKHAYFLPVTRSHRHGRKTSSFQTRCLWVDIDDHHRFEKAASECPRKPSFIVRTGSGGGHLYWLFDKPITVRDGTEAAYVFEQALKEISCRLGGDPSVTHTAVNLRLPGSYNVKMNPPVAVTWEATGAVYPVDFIAHMAASFTNRNRHIPKPAKPTGQRLKSLSADTMVSECGFMQYAGMNPNDLNEIEWFAMLRCLAAFPDGESIGHYLSSGYHRYSERETSRKFSHAQKYEPASCNTFEHCGHCGGCDWRNIVNSPAGIPYKLLKKRA